MKTKNRIWIYLLFVMGAIGIFYSSCKKEKVDRKGNPVQRNTDVIEALRKAGITTYDGSTPPNLEGLYSTTPMSYYAASPNLQSLIGNYMNSIFKLYGQSTSDISFAEKLPSGTFNDGHGAYITGSDKNFTIWQFINISTGGQTALVFSGTVGPTYDLISVKSLTVYTESTMYHEVGDWFAATGGIIRLDPPVPMLPIIGMNPVKIISNTSVHLSGKVIDWGNYDKTYASGTGFSIDGNWKGNSGSFANDSFSMDISGVTPGTHKYAAYVVINVIRGNMTPILSKEISFQMLVPLLTTQVASDITQVSAKIGGNITDDGGSAITSRGHCWSINPSPVITDNKTVVGTGKGSFTSSITGLLPKTLYYVRSYAINSIGVTYGNEVSFTTLTDIPTIGQSYQGGIIGYIYLPGDPNYIAGQVHGLIVAPSDQGTSVEWGCDQTAIGTSTELGKGGTNTTAIVNGCSQAGIAARLCNDLVLGGYSDWFLPSIDELKILYSNKYASKIGLTWGDNWSSSEDGSGSAIGLWIGGSGSHQNNYGKKQKNLVRAVRAF